MDPAENTRLAGFIPFLTIGTTERRNF